MSSATSSKEELPVLCEWDGMKVLRNPDATWISKVWAMKGPTGLMMDKVIPEKYASRIEKDYQDTIKNPDKKYPKVNILGRISGNSLIKAEPKPEPKKVKSKAKPPKKKKAGSKKNNVTDKKPKSKKKAVGGLFNPFE